MFKNLSKAVKAGVATYKRATYVSPEEKARIRAVNEAAARLMEEEMAEEDARHEALVQEELERLRKERDSK